MLLLLVSFDQFVNFHGEKIFDFQFNLGSGTNENANQLSAGQSVFPFTYQLPPNLPSSFEGICYVLK